jgi:SAM-dependent methyltransferase
VITVLILVAGALVSLPAFIHSPESQLLEVSPPPPETHFLDTQPLSSPSVTRQFALIPSAVRYSMAHPYEDRRDGLNRLRTLSLWQLGAMRALGRQGLIVGAAGTTLLLLSAVAAGRKVRISFREIVRSQRSVEPEADAGAAAYQGVPNLEAMEVARRYNDFLTSTVLSRVDASRPVLDFGAGTGTHARQLRERGLDVRCVEPDPQLRGVLERDGFLVVADVRDLERASFASIYSLNVLEHIEDDEEALRQLFAVTDAGGRLILYVPAFQILFSAMDRKVGHQRRYRMRLLSDHVRAAGFRVISCRYVDSVGFFAALAYRLLARNGELSPTSVARYDKWLFPASRALDRVTGRWIRKNLLLEARRD